MRKPITVSQAIEQLFTLAETCCVERSYEAAKAACRGTRTAWDAVHNQANFYPMQLSKDDLLRAAEGIKQCLSALAHVDITELDLAQQEQIQDGFKRNMVLRLELVMLLQRSGLKAVDERVREFLEQSASRGAKVAACAAH